MKPVAQVRLLTVALAALATALAQTAPTVPPVSPTQTAAQAAAAAGQSAQATQIATPGAVSVAPVALPASVLAPSGVVAPPSTAGETAVTLDVGNGFRYVPPSRITVPVGETLFITGPSFGGRPVQWLKDGKPLANATGTLLALPSVGATDAGTYQLVNNEPNVSSVPSQLLILGVGPTARLLNLSTRGTLAAGPGQNFTAGFVVAAGAAQTKRLILRAIGPTLAAFGVANPLRAPVLRIFDAAGNSYTNGYVYPAVVGGLTYETDLANALAQTGAFPIPSGTLDAVVMMPFLPGTYTAQVTSGDNTAGNVLVEIYEVP